MTSLAASLGRSQLAAPLEQGQDVTGPEPDAPSLLSLVGDAVNSEWLTGHLNRAFTTHLGSLGQNDPGYDPFDHWGELTEGVDPEYWTELRHARGALHAQQIKDNILSRQASRQRLSEAGLTGVALTLGANIADPLTLAVGAATGGVGAVGTKATRLARFARYGMANAAVDTPLEGLRVSTDPDAGALDLVISVAGSFALGGGAGVAIDGLQQAALRDLRRAELNEVLENAHEVGVAMGAAAARDLGDPVRGTLRAQLEGAGFTDYWRKYVSPAMEPEARRSAVLATLDQISATPEMRDELVEILDTSGVDEVYERLMSPQYETPHVGRLTDEPPPAVDPDSDVPVEPPLAYKAGDLDPKDASDARASWTLARGSYSSFFGQSNSAAIRKLGNMLVEDALLKQDGRGQGTMAASMWADATTKKMGSRFFRAHEAAYKSIPQSLQSSKSEFAERVSLAVVNSDFSHAIDPGDTADVVALKNSVKAARDLFGELGSLAQRHGVRGFETFEPNQYYLPRFLDVRKINALYANHGQDEVEGFVARAFQASSETLDDDLALRMARGYLRTARGLDKIDVADGARVFDPENAEILRGVLKDDGKISDESIEDVLAQVTRKPQAQSRFALSRTGGQDTEEFFEILPTRDGGTRRVSFRADLFDSNIESIMQRYTHSMVGTSAMSMVYRRFGEALGRTSDNPITTRGEMIAAAKREAKDESAAYLQKLEHRLDMIDKVIRGQPIEQDNLGNALLRRLRAASFMTFGGGFGLAQLPEIGQIIGRQGARAMMQQLPAMREIWKRGADGRLQNDMVDLAESLGFGTDHLMNRLIARLDFSDNLTDHVATGGVGARIDQVQRGVNRKLSEYSGLAPVNMALQRLAAMSAVQRFVNLSMDGRVVNDAGQVTIGPSLGKVMEGLNLSEEKATRLIKAIRAEKGKAISVEPGMLGNRVRRVNVDAFDDQDAVSDLLDAVTVWARSSIIQSDLGQMNSVLLNPIGKTFLQFQSFHIAAWEKVLLSGLQRANWEEFVGWSVSSMVGAFVFSAQMHAMANARDDKKNFLKNRLGVESFEDQLTTPDGLLNTLSAGIQRGGWSSFAPQAIDNLTNNALGYGPVFNARNTGLNGLLFDPRNAPSGAMIDNTLSALRGVTSALPGDDREFSQSDLRAIKRVLPWQNLPLLGEMLELGVRQAPEDE